MSSVKKPNRVIRGVKAAEDAEEHDAQLHQQRGGAEHGDIGTGDTLDDAVLAQAHQSQHQSGDHGQQNGHNGQQQSELHALNEHTAVLGQEGQVKE